MRFTFLSNANMPKSRPTLRSMFQRIHLMIIAITLLMAGIPLSVLSVFTLKSYAEHNLQLVAATISYTSAAAVVFGDKPAAQDALTLIAKKNKCMRRGSTIKRRSYSQAGPHLPACV